MDITHKRMTYEELYKQNEFHKNKMEAAEAKLSLIARGFKVELPTEETNG